MMKTNIILRGDVVEKLKELPDNSVDSIVTDPPYGIGFMGKEWDNFESSYIEKEKNKEEKRLEIKPRTDGRTVSRNSPSMKAGSYDLSMRGQLGFQNWVNSWAKECLRVLKPGGFLLSFGGTRTYHRLACGVEDVGFEIRDCIQWLYGSGFPKSLNIGKQIDKIQGNEREIIGVKEHTWNQDNNSIVSSKNDCGGIRRGLLKDEKFSVTKGNSDWEGWGTALKPANEPIVVARKPLSEKNVALNVLKWGTGGINIDKCRIGNEKHLIHGGGKLKPEFGWNNNNMKEINKIVQGRFPANIIFDEEAARLLDKQSGVLSPGGFPKQTGGVNIENDSGIYGKFNPVSRDERINTGIGGASRFFYVAKASKGERNAGCEELPNTNSINGDKWTDADRREDNNPTIRKNFHPTVKPVQLMQYLVKLVTPKEGIVLDCFLGSGTTAIAALKEGFKFIGIEKNEEYINIAEARLKPYLTQKKLREYQK